MSVEGKIYLERGAKVLVLAQWKGKGPRNVLIRRPNGEEVVRPFRGLRKATKENLWPGYVKRARTSNPNLVVKTV